MSYVKCNRCGRNYFKDFSNPNIHYSTAENDVNNFKCHQCIRFESLKVGEWYQDEKGEYHQKTEEDDSQSNK